MRISVRVIPRSSKNALKWEANGLKARLTAPPVEGAANEALITLLAAQLDLPRRNISIAYGATSRQKLVDLEGITPEEVERKISPHPV